jgi:hypothetical protein
VEHQKTEIVKGNTLLASHIEQIGNVENQIKTEVEKIR